MIHKVKHKIRQKFPKGGFARNAATIMTGTTIAQIIGILISPILTRIYSPQDFGLFALFSASLAVVTVMITLKYENAIMLPSDDEDAINIVALSTIIAFSISMMVLTVVIIFGKNLMVLLDGKGTENWLFFYPVSIFFAGIYLPFYNWLNRLGHYKTMAYRTVIQVIVTSVMSLILGVKGYHSTGLIISFILGQIVVVIILFWDFYVTSKKYFSLIRFHKIRQQIKRHIKFPLYDLPSSFISIVVNQAPIFVFNKYFGSNNVGLYSFANKILGMPSNLMAGSVLCVFKQRATQDYNKNGNCIHIYKKTFKSLLLFSAFPFIILALFSPSLFVLIFGSQWRQAGVFASILCVMFAIRFVTSPLAYMFYVAEKQRYDFIGQILFLISTAIAITLGVYYNSLKLSVIVLTAGHSIVYLLYLFVSYELAKGLGRDKKVN